MLRYEFKFLVPDALLDLLRRRLAPFVEEDRYAHLRAEHQYTVRSVYFDTHDFRDFHQKIDGLEFRKKVRIRGYNQAATDSLVFLEVKRKYGQFIAKNRAPVPWASLTCMLEDRDIERYVQVRPGFATGRQDAHSFFYQIIAGGLRPAILISYEREAYFVAFDRRVRITFDKNIRYYPASTPAVLFEEERLTTLYKHHFILELKFHDSLPEWLRDLIRDLGLQRQALSKYVLCLEKTRIPFHMRIR